MLPIVAGAIIGAGAGLLKGLSEREKKKLEAKAQAEIARWSPWTGIQPQTTGLGDKTGDYILSGATTGAAMGQGVGGGEGTWLADPADGGRTLINSKTGAKYEQAGPLDTRGNF
jgi:hypothetical protein